MDTVDDTELPDVTVTQDGLNVILQPTGTTDTEKLTDPLNPPRDDTVTFTILDEGTLTLMVEGEAEMGETCGEDGSDGVGHDEPILRVVGLHSKHRHGTESSRKRRRGGRT